MKFSFVVPVFNGEKYIKRCIDSLLNQTYKNFEIIIINDGSTDNSKKILEECQKENSDRIKLFNQENKGLSATRNLGITKITGDYLLFVDIDDYISLDTLKILNNHCKKSYDLIKFEWTSNGSEANSQETLDFTGSEALKYLINKKKVFEMATIYAYRVEFLKAINFKFTIGRYHEDFGAIPITILKASKILLLNDILYFYDQNTTESIIRTKNYEKCRKKAFDVLEFYKEVKSKLNKSDIKNIELIKLLNSFNANAVFRKRSELNTTDRKKYDAIIKKKKIFNDIQNIFKRFLCSIRLIMHL